MASPASRPPGARTLDPTDLMKAEDDLWEKVDVSNANLGQAIRMRQAGLSREASRFSALSLAEAPWTGESLTAGESQLRPQGIC